MKLLLQKNIEHVGQIGDVVDVAAGYARNFLLPQGLAVELTKDNIHRFESMKRRLIALEEENKAKFQVLAKELEKASVTIIANSTEEGHLYGSVSARDISAQLATDGLAVDPKCILLEIPIKELGIYKVKIRLHPDVECKTKVWVVKGDVSAAEREAMAAEIAEKEDGEDEDAAESDESES